MTANAIDMKEIKRFIDEIVKCDAELLSEWGVYASRCKGIRDRKNDWKDRAKDAGVPRCVINPVLKLIKFEAEKARLTDGLNEDQVDMFDYVVGGLGDYGLLPLGQAAAAAAAKGQEVVAKKGRGKNGANDNGAKLDALNSLIDPDEVAAKAAATNATLLEGGIKQLNYLR